jgi:hypothetical protein
VLLRGIPGGECPSGFIGSRLAASPLALCPVQKWPSAPSRFPVKLRGDILLSHARRLRHNPAAPAERRPAIRPRPPNDGGAS